MVWSKVFAHSGLEDFRLFFLVLKITTLYNRELLFSYLVVDDSRSQPSMTVYLSAHNAAR